MNTSAGKGSHTWALVLAAGSGTRLQSLTTDVSGVAVPKQFCSLRGGPSLLREALLRAEAVAARERTCTVVAQQHSQWWSGQTRGLPAENVIVQPENRGTANGILLPVLHILERDPDANIVLLPSDQHITEEAILIEVLHRGVASLRQRQREILLIGIAPDEADPELGYIVPGASDGKGGHRIEAFVEKPTRGVAEQLILAGALWNAFIVVARARALIELFTLRAPQLVADMRAVASHDAVNPSEPVAAAGLYRSLPEADFSRHIVQGQERAFSVLAAPPCGWTDLGTPQRVAQTLRRVSRQPSVPQVGSQDSCGALNLAEQFAGELFQRGGYSPLWGREDMLGQSQP